jgi:hypothetical protein
MNDDTERVTCPVCGNGIVVILDWQGAEPDTGVRAGWFGGIAIEDTDCFKHMTYAQIEATVNSAIIQREMRDEEAAHEEASRINAEEIDEMRRFDAWNRAHDEMAPADWHGEIAPF